MKKLLVTLLLIMPFIGHAQEEITSPQTLCSPYAQKAWGVQPNSLLMTYDINIEGPLDGNMLWFRVNGQPNEQLPISGNGRITHTIHGVSHGPSHTIDAQLWRNGVFITQYTLDLLTYVWDPPSIMLEEVQTTQVNDTTVLSGTVTVPTIYGFPETEAVITCDEHRPVVTIWVTDGTDTLSMYETEQYGHHLPGTETYDSSYPFEFHYGGTPRFGTVCVTAGIMYRDNGPSPLDFEQQKITSVAPGSVISECGLTLLGSELSTGLHEDSGMNISLYPNPSNSAFSLSGATAGQLYSITDCAGRTVLTGQTSSVSTNIDASKWPAGTYIIRIEDNIFRAVRD